MQRHAHTTTSSNGRRARTLAGSLALLLIGVAFYAHNAHARDLASTGIAASHAKAAY